ncbi:MAG: SAM-dependent methyltransferase [Thermoanaerobaculia bacterium]|nr:SAM-dependent methyltransferase [Thermoanaerobaculia bacterium]
MTTTSSGVVPEAVPEATGAEAGRRPPLVSVALAAGLGLACEILLLRLFSIVQFHHTAYMVISLSLLGYGASGTLLAVTRRWWMTRLRRLFPWCLTLFGLSAVGCFAVAQRIAVHPEELLWSPGQVLWMVVLYLLLAVPFFFLGLSIGSALMGFSVDRVYAADLGGAGVGTLLVVGLLWVAAPGDALRLLAVAGLLAALVGAWELDRQTLGRTAFLLLAAVGIYLVPSAWVDPQPSSYKGLTQALRVQGAKLVEERSSPLALVSVVESGEVPLRHAPGLSLAAPQGPPEQVGVFVDAEALLPILRWQPERLEYLGYSTAALPYAMGEPEEVLVLGAGGGVEVARALHHGAESVVGVEIDPQIVDLVRTEYGEFSGDLYRRPEVEVVVEDVRGYAATESHRFDLVVLAAVGGYGGGGPALAALAESYLHTVEAFDAYLDLVEPGGLLTATVHVKNPPRDAVKLAATAIRALEHRTESDPAASLALIRSWQTATLVVKRGRLSAAEIEGLREFGRERFFDPIHYPGMSEEEANRYNRLPEPLFHRAVASLFGAERDRFLERYKFDVRPTTDDRPFFHQFFRWRTLGELAAARGSGGLSLLEAGYLVLIVTLLQAVILGFVLIVAPLVVLRRDGAAGLRGRVVVYFGALGLGFLLLEVAFLQKLILVLNHPVYSAAVVLASFLVFAGLGSALAPRARRLWGDRAVLWLAAGIIGVGAGDLAVLGAFSGAVAGASMTARIAFTISLVAPLAFLMGMPFALGLGALKERAEDLVPWAWAINGCASVVSPIVATLLAVHHGFGFVVLLGLAAYAVAGFCRIRPVRTAAAAPTPSP